MRRSLFIFLAVLFVLDLCVVPGTAAQAQIKTLYVVQLSHADIGFDAPPSVMYQRNHERTVAALNLADQYSDFHWTIETSYQLEGFLTNASAADINRLKARLSEGRFTFGGNYTNLHSGLCGEREFERMTAPAADFAAQLGVSANTAMLDDVPGFTVAMPRVLSESNVPYAVLGANDFIGGKPAIPLQDRPFWWEGRDGSRVLSWLCYGSYIEGYFDWGLTSVGNARNKVLPILAEFEAAGYPYDAVMVLRGTDDEIPNTVMPQLAIDWNRTYNDIEIRLATPADFFGYLLDTYGDVFPTYTGDASGMWESAAMVTPATTARVRRARTRLADLETLWEEIGNEGGPAYPKGMFDAAWKYALIFDEHSGGGFGWPGHLTEQEVRQENQEFVSVALRCEALTATLEGRATSIAGKAVVPKGEANLVLFNPADSAYEGVMEVESTVGPLPADLRFDDPEGGPDLAFRWLNAQRTAIAFRVSIPANGYRRWVVANNGTTPPPPTWSDGNTITVGDLELGLDAQRGTAVTLMDHTTSINWLAQRGPHRFGGIEWGTNYEAFLGIWYECDPMPVTIQVEEPSAVFRRMRVFNQRNELIREYRLFDGNELRVDVTVVMRRSELPFVPLDDHSHHYCVSFPANLSPTTTLWVAGPDGWYQPGVESLPGACLGHFASSTGARIEDRNGRWVSITSLDSPMLDLGEMNDSALPDIEVDELGLSWKLIRHADLSEVKGGDIVQMDAEPGMPDAMPYEFVVRFGEPGTPPPPGLDVLHRDVSPPLAVFVDRRR
ncbi:MAG: hypothetical protein D8M59_11850 [Planctomycetes bacterium]|nr:hypothetical protein [Planctomycetota bacterium]NOG55454.1 hypothetical protein [Planctomycetota bacterium]